MYKPSLFNVYFSENNQLFLYNSHNGKFAKLNKEYEESFYNIRLKNGYNIPNKHLEDLLDGGFIVSEDYDEIGYYKYLHNSTRFNNSSLGLTIATTLQCNFRCPYCYEEHINKSFGEEEEKELKNFIKHSIKGKSSLSITWYGGEPLLNLLFIDRMSSYLIELTEESDINYSAGIVSNGYLLNRKTAEKLVKNKIKRVQITLDGGPETHNKTRVLSNGMGTFDVILNNIKEIHDIINITIRVNVNENNIKEVYKLFHILIDNNLDGKVKLYLAPVRSYDTTEACQSISESCLSMEDFAKCEIDLAQYANDINFKSLVSLYPRSMGGGICGAVNKHSFVIDSYGDIYKCWNEIGFKDLKVGDIFTGIEMSNYLKWMNWELPNKCLSCNVMPICKSRCPKESLDNKNIECASLKYNIKERLYNYYLAQKDNLIGNRIE